MLKCNAGKKTRIFLKFRIKNVQCINGKGYETATEESSILASKFSGFEFGM